MSLKNLKKNIGLESESFAQNNTLKVLHFGSESQYLPFLYCIPSKHLKGRSVHCVSHDFVHKTGKEAKSPECEMCPETGKEAKSLEYEKCQNQSLYLVR